MFYAIAIAILLFIALIMAASPLLAVIVVIPLFLIYLLLTAVSRRSDQVRGTDETPGSFEESKAQADNRTDDRVEPRPPSGTAADPDREAAPPPPP